MIQIYIRQLNTGEDGHQAGWTLLKEVIGEREIFFSAKGKPFLKEELFFNISHSSHFVGFAVGKQEIGLDLEEPRSLRYTGYRYPEENEMDPLLLWVLKESFVKWTGEGVSALRQTKIKPIGENLYEGEKDGKKAVLQTFRVGELIGALATAEEQEFKIII